jgi:ribosomal protein L34E/transposase-like protein
MNLEKEVKLLRKENKELREENIYFKEVFRALEKRIEELEGIVKEKSKLSFVKEDVRSYHHKSGQKEGHEGVSRETPEKIDEIKKWDLKECPDCGKKLSKIQRKRRRYITDIEVKTKNTENIICGRYCKTCDKIVEPRVTDALPNARFGLKLMLLVLALKLDSRVPSNKIVSILDAIFQIKISDGEIYGILKQLKTAFGDYYAELVQKIKEALVKNIDETSWRIDGKNYWLWNFINKEVALYVVNQRRSSKVPMSILGNQEGKTIVSDRYSAYNKFVEKSKCNQQICWSHILRDSKDLAEHYHEAKYIHKRLKHIYDKAKEGEKKEKLLHWINLIASRAYRSSEVYKFVKSICRFHRENLFRFVDNPEIDSTNNRAERGLRHAVVIRKISNGSRSKDGAEVTANLLSVLQTAKLQSNNPMDFMSDLLYKGK